MWFNNLTPSIYTLLGFLGAVFVLKFNDAFNNQGMHGPNIGHAQIVRESFWIDESSVIQELRLDSRVVVKQTGNTTNPLNSVLMALENGTVIYLDVVGFKDGRPLAVCHVSLPNASGQGRPAAE